MAGIEVLMEGFLSGFNSLARICITKGEQCASVYPPCAIQYMTFTLPACFVYFVDTSHSLEHVVTHDMVDTNIGYLISKNFQC